MSALDKIDLARAKLIEAHNLLAGEPGPGALKPRAEPATPALPSDIDAPLDTSHQTNLAMAAVPTGPAIKVDMSRSAAARLVMRSSLSLPTVTDVDGDTFQVPSYYALIGVDEELEFPRGSGELMTATEHGGGTLIRPNWILTAAHVVCSVDPDTGELTSKSKALRVSMAPAGRDKHTEQFVCGDVYVHPYYDAGFSSYSADLALIRLPEPSQYQPIRDADMLHRLVQPGELIGTYGMGATKEGGNIHTEIQYQRMRATRYIRDHAVKLTREKGNFEQGYSGGPSADDDEQKLWIGVVSRYMLDPVTGQREFVLVPAPRALSWANATIDAIKAAEAA